MPLPIEEPEIEHLQYLLLFIICIFVVLHKEFWYWGKKPEMFFPARLRSCQGLLFKT